MQINTNVLSLTAQRNGAASQASLATALERLSTGLRINSAGDDAAGLAISERLTAQIRGQSVAQRSANDAISLAQTAEGALGVVSDGLQRMRELTLQSLNGLNTDGDRAAIQEEVRQLRQEVERIAQDTTFNGMKVLGGGRSSMHFQIGAGRGEVLSLRGMDARTSTLGASFPAVISNNPLPTLPAGDYVAAGVALGAPPGTDNFSINSVGVSVEGIATPDALVEAINQKGPETGVEATLDSAGKLVLTDAAGNLPSISGHQDLLQAMGLNDGGGNPTYAASTVFRALDSAEV